MKLLAALLLTFSAFGAETLKNCTLESINFKNGSPGRYEFKCGEDLKSFPRSRRFEHELVDAFTKSLSFSSFTPAAELRNLIVDQDRIVGFTNSAEITMVRNIRLDRKVLEVITEGGEVLATISKEQLDNAKVVEKNIIRREFAQFDRVVVQKTRDFNYRNTIAVVENCYPKRCGTTTYITLPAFAAPIIDFPL